MEKHQHVAVIDIGKTNAKLALISMPDMRELDLRSCSNRVILSAPYPHHDTLHLQKFIIDALADFHRQHGVDVISVTAHGATIALLKANHELAFPVMDYDFDGPDVLRADYENLRAPFLNTGSPSLSAGLNAAAQIYWLQRHHSDAFNAVSTIVTYPQFWSGWLTGVYCNEVTSLGCHTDLWDPFKAQFSSTVDALDLLPIMAPIKPAKAVLGPLRNELVRQTGLAATTPVHCGIHDSNASLLPHLLSRDQPFGVISTGTWIVCMAVGGRQMELVPDRDISLNVDINAQPVPSSRFMGGREYALITDGHEAKGTLEDLETIVSGNRMIIPQVVAGVGPFANATSNWQTATNGLSAGQIDAIASLYLALVTTQCLRLIGARGTQIVEGPLARNGLFLSALHILTEKPIHTNTMSQTGTTMGAALLVGSGSLPDQTRDASSQLAVHPELAQMIREYARRWNAGNN